MDHRYITKTILLNEGNTEQKRGEILDYFHKTYKLDEHLFDVFVDQTAMFLTADPLRHPLIFYFGHTAAFYINKLVISKIINKRINPAYESMFAIGVDEMSWDDLNQSNYQWPTVSEVKDYRDKVFEIVDHLIRTFPLQIPIRWDDPFWIILMAIEHSRIHIETSSVLIRQLPLEALKPIPDWEICSESGPAPVNRLIAEEGGEITLGKDLDNPLYGWDNEYGVHRKTISEFHTSEFLCSNGEFKQFVDDNGYNTTSWWSEEGWKWRTFKKAEFPLFWRKAGNTWKLRLVYNEIEIPWNWPVEVNYLEAKAFCNWKSAKNNMPVRLPSEEEWYLLHQRASVPDQPYWDVAPGNINLEHFQSPCPVDKFRFGKLYDLIGNVWQWTETAITGYEGFKIHPSYDDFSTPTFDMRHNIIKGGSWISTGNEAIRDSRYAFRRHFYQHAGFRYVVSEDPVEVKNDSYEADPEVILHCESHYAKSVLDIPNYRKAIAEFCLTLLPENQKNCALDMGCKTGRTTWELAKGFQFVTGVDLSARTIRVASQLQEHGRFNYLFPEEGEIVKYCQVTLDDFGFRPLIGKVKFLQSDLSNLKSSFWGYDLILLNDVPDQIYRPKSLLSILHERLNDNGIVVVASAWDWNNELTKPEDQLGGFRVGGEPVRGVDTLKEIMQENFTELEINLTLPSVERINQRKSVLKMMDVSVWRKK